MVQLCYHHSSALLSQFNSVIITVQLCYHSSPLLSWFQSVIIIVQLCYHGSILLLSQFNSVTIKVQLSYHHGSAPLPSRFISVSIMGRVSVPGGSFPHLVWTGRTFVARRLISAASQPCLLHAGEHHSSVEAVHVRCCRQLLMRDCICVQAMCVEMLGQVWLGADVLLTESLAWACACWAHRRWG